MVDARLSTCADQDVLAAVEALEMRPHIMPAPSWPGEEVGIQESGLYSWWVDEAGAADLTEGLELPIVAGRIYAGQTGATRWPSGTPSSATLEGRIRSQHLGGTIYGSTFRLTLASSLAKGLELTGSGGKRLAAGGEQRLQRMDPWVPQRGRAPLSEPRCVGEPGASCAGAARSSVEPSRHGSLPVAYATQASAKGTSRI